MIMEHDIEPVPGLPERLPVGEAIIWQGSPDWKRMALGAFHVRGIAIYFGLLLVFAVTQGSVIGIALTAASAVIGLALLALLAWGSARTTIYTLTNKRVVMRIGIALPKCINLPLTLVESAELALHPGGTGDIPMKVIGAQRLGYAALWPHARAWKLATPQPMLRAVPDGQAVAAMLAKACGARLSVAPAQPLEALAA